MQLAELHLQCLAGLQHGLGDPLQHRVTRDQRAHPRRKLPFADLAHLGIDVARHADVYEEGRSVASRFEGRTDGFRSLVENPSIRTDRSTGP